MAEVEPAPPQPADLEMARAAQVAAEADRAEQNPADLEAQQNI